MLHNSKCSAVPTLLSYNIILFLSIQVSGKVPPFPFFPPPMLPPYTPELPPTPEFPFPFPVFKPPPFSRALPPPPEFSFPGYRPPPFPGTLPPIEGLRQPIPGLLTPPTVPELCPKNEVTMKIVCANVIGKPALPVSRLLNPLSSPCCKYIDGLLDVEVANCFCQAVTFDKSDPKTNIPASLVSLLDYCQKELPRGFRCATSSTSASR